MIVADAGPLIAFVRIGRLDLLHEVLGEVIVPGAVYDELVIGGRGKAGADDIAGCSVEVIGTLAVIAEAKRRNLVDHARPLLARMITSGYWLDVDLVMAFLAEVGEREDLA